jgi:hypothetical protein
VIIPCASIENKNTKGMFGGGKDDRKALRDSYGCGCDGAKRIGRVNPRQTDYILKAIESYTGRITTGCPWRALSLPIVAKSIALFQHYEAGNLAAFLTDQDDEREWLALEEYIRASHSARAKEFDERAENDREKSKKTAK